MRQLTNTLDFLTKSVFDQLGMTSQAVFFLGDGLQRLAVDGAFDLFDPRKWTPANFFRISSMIARQAASASELFTSPETACLAWQELRNKLEIFTTVINTSSILGISEGQAIDLPQVVEKAYSLSPFQALWGIEGLGHAYASWKWGTDGTITHLLWEENAVVPEKSLLMLHAGLGLFLADWFLGSGTPTLIANSPFSEFRAAIEEFVKFARDNAREGYLGPVIESLGLVTREIHADMVHTVNAALREVAPELTGYFWHGVGRALYFSRRYFVPVLSTVWDGVYQQAQSAPEQQSAIAGLAWAVVLVNMNQPEIVENVLRNNIQHSSLQDGFSNGVASSVVMRQATTPDAPLINSFCRHRPSEDALVPLWERLLASPCSAALNQYYPVLRDHHALGEIFRYQDLAALTARLQGGPASPPARGTAGTRILNPWTWQDKLGFSQAIEVPPGHRVVYFAGQTSVDANGTPVYPNDLAKQVNQALDNLETVLKEAGLTLANVVRLNYYVTAGVDALSKAGPAYGPRLAAAGCKPTVAAVGVTSLFLPELMVEIEAIAVG